VPDSRGGAPIQAEVPSGDAPERWLGIEAWYHPKITKLLEILDEHFRVSGPTTPVPSYRNPSPYPPPTPNTPSTNHRSPPLTQYLSCSLLPEYSALLIQYNKRNNVL